MSRPRPGPASIPSRSLASRRPPGPTPKNRRFSQVCLATCRAPPPPRPSPSMFLQHSPPPWSCYPAVCRWPGCPHPGPGSAGSCPAPTPARGSLGLSDSSPGRSPGRPIQRRGLHPDLGEGDRKVNVLGVRREGLRGEPAPIRCRGPAPTPSLLLGTLTTRAGDTPHALRDRYPAPLHALCTHDSLVLTPTLHRRDSCLHFTDRNRLPEVKEGHTAGKFQTQLDLPPKQ